ncbi:RdgB/HAM1 family non-canonical purine NTP pyrophosphatase [Cytophagaceae bacterium AH-315-L13]|nr:RdgB/HAM1 family non-canonical purine NTP pyrophosphatase [Cytophagaceae bacterium AH-315-L13]
MELVFATNNQHKLQEVREVLGVDFKILSLKDIGCFEELPETHDSLEGNAKEKAEYVFDKHQIDCFADDTGLEIDALNGEPGVYSARFSGDNATFESNMDLVLEKMNKIEKRACKFRTIIHLISGSNNFIFEGEVEGMISDVKSGKAGFGYDPIFVPKGYDISFAEMTLEEKNKISHRGLAVKKLVTFLSRLKVEVKSSNSLFSNL